MIYPVSLVSGTLSGKFFYFTPFTQTNGDTWRYMD